MKPTEFVSGFTRRCAAFFYAARLSADFSRDAPQGRLLRRITSSERPNFGVSNDQDVDCGNHCSVHGIQRQCGNKG